MFSSYSYSQNHIELPQEIKTQMKSNVQYGECQSEWALSDPLIQTFETGAKNQKIYAVVCSIWSYNQAWSLFLVIDQGGNKKLVKPLSFIRYSSFKGLYSDSVVENISWDKKNKTLTSKSYLNGNAQCGERSGYKWSTTYQVFSVIAIHKNDECSTLPSKWTRVL
jgi:hypothetical protein